MMVEMQNITDKVAFAVTLLISEQLSAWGTQKRDKFWLRLIAGILFTMAVSNIPFEDIFGGGWSMKMVVAKHMVIFFSSVAAMWFAYNEHIWKCFFTAVLALCVHQIGNDVDLMVNAIAPTDDLLTGYIISAFSYAGTFFVLHIAFHKKFRESLKFTTKGKVQTVSSFLILVGVIYISFYAMAFTFVVDSRELRVYLCILTILACFVCILMEQALLSVERQQMELAVTENMLKLQKQQYQENMESINIINTKCHDLRHQFFDVGLSRDQSEMKDLINSINMYDNTFRTGCEALDVVLTMKGAVCSAKNIRLTCSVDGTAMHRMAAHDIYALFGNAIENAMESVEKLDEEHRLISISMERRGSFANVRVENYCAGEIQFENGLPVSPKDHNYHGYGMKSMKMIAEKYGGGISADVHDSVFTLNIFLVTD